MNNTSTQEEMWVIEKCLFVCTDVSVPIYSTLRIYKKRVRKKNITFNKTQEGFQNSNKAIQ